MDLGSVRKVNINDEMQQAYLDYAMSVIVSRALPDARDGLKPVQRRILYAMFDMGLRPETAFKKSARIVGEVLGKYHPHGDSAVYEAMARLAQDFSVRYMLVEGQGNFGSVDGDPPAAMRYTEARLTAQSIDIIQQLDMDTVDFADNFDGTLQEPEVMPAAIPNLLVNGSSGIAVGMATNIPPHNLGEVIDALVMLLERWEKLDDISVDDLMKHIKGPDFPTGGMIIQEDQADTIAQAYGTGNGKIIIRARVRLEEMARGKSRLIVSELPFMVNKSSLMERIAELSRDGAIEGITDLRDESDRQGMRIVIETGKSAEAADVLAMLYKRTPMQTTFGINMLALVNHEPHKLTLKQALRVFAEHRFEVIKRRSIYELKKNEARLHILEALKIALANLDEVIEIIRRSRQVETARESLKKRFKLDDVQVQAILDMPLRRLAALERKKIDQEYDEVKAKIKELQALLKSEKKMRLAVIDELKLVKEKYADPRRTQIIRLDEGMKASQLLTTDDVMPEENIWVGISEDGKIGRTENDQPFRLSGKNAPRLILRTTTHQTLFLVATDGKACAISVHSLPAADKLENGTALHLICAMNADDRVVAAFTLPRSLEKIQHEYLVTISQLGMVKRSKLADLPGPSASSFTLGKTNDDDEILDVLLTSGSDDILLTSQQGMSIRFAESEMRVMGLVAVGVGGMKLRANDFIIAADVVPAKGWVCVVTNSGKAKRIDVADFPTQGRNGSGVIACKLAKDEIICGQAVGNLKSKWIGHFRQAAAKQLTIGEAAERTRNSIGQKLIEVKLGDDLVFVSELMDFTQR